MLLPLFEPSRWMYIHLKGADAADFLHRLSTVNVKNLKVGTGAPGCFLSPQGRIRSYFHLWRVDQNEFYFELDCGPGTDSFWKDAFHSFVDQYTFGEKLVWTTVEKSCLWMFPENDQSLAAYETKTEGELQFFHHGAQDYGRSWVSVWGTAEDLAQWQAKQSVSILSTLDVERWRIHALRPRIGVEILESTLPVEVGLSAAIAQNKGCYPGQEVIEKVISLGFPARRLGLVSVDLALSIDFQVGMPILNRAQPPVEVGVVTSWVQNEDQTVSVLGLIRKMHAKEGLEVQFGSIQKIAPYAD